MIRLRPCTRFPRPPLILAVIVAAWSLAVAGSWLVTGSTDQEIRFCHFRTVTGVPCATCGGSRAAFSLVSGDLAGALRFNPLVTLALVSCGPVLALRLLQGKTLILQFGRRGWLLATVFLVTAVAVNWLYVAAYHLAE